MFSTLFPSNCRLCSEPLQTISRLPVCPACVESVQPTSCPICAICGERLNAFDSRFNRPLQQITHSNLLQRAVPEDNRCRFCQKARHPYARIAYYGSYEGTLRDIIHLLKYEKVLPAARVLGKLVARVIAVHLAAEFGPRLPIVIPVPLHAAKLRKRGFNQAAEIAIAAMQATKNRLPDLLSGNEVGGGGTFAAAETMAKSESLAIERKALVRLRYTETQTGMTNHQRRLNVRGAFAVTNDALIHGRDVLLIDDVFTTGATVSECARALRHAGAGKVWVATAARVLKLFPATGAPPDGAQA